MSPKTGDIENQGSLKAALFMLFNLRTVKYSSIFQSVSAK